MGNLARKLAAITRPKVARDYLGWMLSSARTGGHPTRTLLGGIEIGNFSSFSEYHSVPEFVSEEERRFFETWPVGDGVIVDVGANVGLVSLLMARRFPDRPVHAFEPNPSTFAALEANAARNRAGNIQCHRAAVSEAEGTVLFENDPVKRGTASIALQQGEHSAEVPATTLDAFAAAQGVDRIGLLKIDVEGFETLVLRGAARVLAEVRPAVIYFEVCPMLTESRGFDPAGPAQMLADAGYALSRLGERGAPQPAAPADVASIPLLENWLATPR